MKIYKSQVSDIEIEEICHVLQESLIKGWNEFRKSSLFKEYSKLANMINWYKSGLREIIPYPAYQLSSQQIGRYFIKQSRELGISFDEIFPGNFEESKENKNSKRSGREFHLTAYINGKPLGIIYFYFSHLHRGFDFPEPPKIRIKT